MEIATAGLPALIVIDSGFSWESLADANNILAVCDLEHGNIVCGSPFVENEALAQFAGDALNHGSTVLNNLRALAPKNPLILIRAFRGDSLIRTTWNTDGSIATRGWTEAYLWAVELCRKLGIGSVANCSFGGLTHAMDGTGWEAFQLGKAGPGHLVVAASGPGDGRHVHASWQAQPGKIIRLEATQTASTAYNFWAGAPHQQWWLRVSVNGTACALFKGEDLPGNLWNNRQQLKFEVPGEGQVTFEFVIPSAASEVVACDIWVMDQVSSRFNTDEYIDNRLVSEPAVFANVIATGLSKGSYADDQALAGSKPDVLVEGDGPISFRTPEVTARVAVLLADDPTLTPATAKRIIGKNL